ncbi:MAG: type IX secretion system outer membrane channel protein PorV [Prevotellaceae bacterium]|nr:type IX secretion system outer membrane channel protein PorV [Prevotellaceae bacterium]
MLPTSRNRLFLLGILLLPFYVAAQTINKDFNPIPVAVPIINISPDARSSGMGDMGVATSPDVYSQYWNAAKYPFTKPRTGLGLSITPWLATLVKDVRINYGALYYRFDNMQSVSTSIRYFSIGSMDIMSNEGNFITNVTPNEFSMDIAYARRFGDHIGAALTGRYIRSDLTGGLLNTGGGESVIMSPANTFSFDMAVYYQNDHGDNNYAWGITTSNLGTKVAYIKENSEKYFLPTTLRVGGQYTFNINADNSVMLGLELSKLLVPTPPVRDSLDRQIVLGKSSSVGLVESWIQSFYDAPYGWEEELSEVIIGGGIEYIYRGLLATRMGYFHDSKRKGNRRYLTFGAGIKYNFIGLDVSYLYPFTTTDPLSNTLRVSLLFDFNLQYQRSSSSNENRYR